MQMASKEYIESMKLPFRNRGYVKVSIGVVNSDAQNNAKVTNTELLYLANKEKPFDGSSTLMLNTLASFTAFDKLQSELFSYSIPRSVENGIPARSDNSLSVMLPI